MAGGAGRLQGEEMGGRVRGLPDSPSHCFPCCRGWGWGGRDDKFRAPVKDSIPAKL